MKQAQAYPEPPRPPDEPEPAPGEQLPGPDAPDISLPPAEAPVPLM